MPNEYDNNLDQERRPEPNTLRVENEALRRGFTLIPNYVLRARGLSRDAKLLYGILLSYAWQSGSCFPGYETLMDDMQCAREAIAKYIKELREKGLIEVKRRGQGKTSIYTIKDLDTGQTVGKLSPDEAESHTSQPQKFDNRTSRSSVSRLQGVRLSNGEEDTVEEDTIEQDSVSSKGNISQKRKRNASRFSKKSVPNQQNNVSEALEDPDSRPRRAAQPDFQPIGQLISHRQALLTRL